MSEVETAGITQMKLVIVNTHNDIMSDMENAMHKAIMVGEYLMAVKDQLEHGQFQPWIEENLPFSLRTAQNYMKIAKKQDVIEQKGAKMLSVAYEAARDIPPRSNDRKIAKDNEKILDIGEDELDEEEKQWDHNILHPSDFEKPEPDLSYVAIIQKASASLKWAYKQLAADRSSTTPKALGFFIGNLYEMAERIDTWKPENMMACDECDGTGVRASYDSTGNIEHSLCPNCINGKVGLYKRTEK